MSQLIIPTKKSAPTINDAINMYARYTYDPVLWAKEQIGFECADWQKTAWNDFIKHRFVAWSAGSGVGKSASLAVIVLFFLSTRPFCKIACTAPSQHQLYDVLWAEIAKWMGKSKFLSKTFKWTQTRITFKGDPEAEKRWFAVARTSRVNAAGVSAAAEGLQGMHEGNILFLCDESCYDEQTEVLTDSGWKFFKDLKEIDRVYTKDPKTDESFYVAPTKFIRNYYSGKMVRFKTRSLNLLVTPNHNMWAMTSGKGRYGPPKFEQAKDIIDKNRWFSRLSLWKGDGRPVTKEKLALAELLGWFLSKGSISKVKNKPYSVFIAQNKKNAANRKSIVKCAKVLGLNPREYAESIAINNVNFACSLARFGKCNEKYVPQELKDSAPEVILAFLQAFLAGDGYINYSTNKKAKNRMIFYTSSKQLADDLHELLLKVGFGASTKKRKIKGQVKWIKDHYATSSMDGYVVSALHSSAARVESKHITEENYEGYVYCVTAPPHNLLMVRRNGQSVWCGNSGVPDQVMYAIEGSLTTPGAHAILASNPTRRSGFFYRIITDKKYQQDWKVQFIDASVVANKSPWVDRAAIERVIRIYGKNSDYYRVKVQGIPPLAESKALCTPEQLVEAHTREVPNTGKVYIGVDPARFGADQTVVYVRKGLRIAKRFVLEDNLDLMAIARVVKTYIERYNPYKVYVDVIGIGGGVVDKLHELLPKKKSRIVGIHVGQKAIEYKKKKKDGKNALVGEEKFRNLRAQLFWNLRFFIDQIRIDFESEFLDEELTLIEYGWPQTDARLQIESKDDLRAKLGRSCNDADALILCLYDELIKMPSYLVDPNILKIGRSQEADKLEDIEEEEKRIIPFTAYSMSSKLQYHTGSRFKNSVGSMRFKNFGLM